MPMELAEMILEEVLRSYSSIKGHRTRCEKEIDNLLGLLRNQYSSTSEERINDHLEKLERYTLRLSDIKDYLVHLKFNGALDHEEEVHEFLEILDKCSNDVFAVLHNCHATAQAVAAPAPIAAVARANLKLSTSELKPDKLAHDTSMANYRTWMKQFRAYFDAGRLDTLPCMQQQAYLNNCIDEVLQARVNQEASATTPIYSQTRISHVHRHSRRCVLGDKPYSPTSEAVFRRVTTRRPDSH